MAIYYLGMKTFGRSGGKRGSRATSAAAYRAGERIRDERTGAVYDHHRRRDVLHKEIVLPAKLARSGRELDWARNRATLWNAAEHAEARADSRVAREFVVALPHELSHEQRVSLARGFAQELADRYGSAIDIAVHAPRGDPRNFHAHLLATTREIGPEGLGRKTTLERSGTERYRLGLPRAQEETVALRERWAALANEALASAHVAARVSAVRPDRPSVPHLPIFAFRMEQRGARSFVAERIRAAHRESLALATRNAEASSREQSVSQRPGAVQDGAQHSEPARAAVKSAGWSDDSAVKAALEWARRYGGGSSASRKDRERELEETSRGLGPEKSGEEKQEQGQERSYDYGNDIGP